MKATPEMSLYLIVNRLIKRIRAVPSSIRIFMGFVEFYFVTLSLSEGSTYELNHLRLAD